MSVFFIQPYTARIENVHVGMSSQEQEVYDKIKAFVVSKYGTFNLDTMTLMFKDYARTGGQASKDDVYQLLTDAEIPSGFGAGLTRNIYRNKIVEQIDTNGDGFLSVDEFIGAMKKAFPEFNTPPPPPVDPVAAAKAANDKLAAAKAVADMRAGISSAKDLNTSTSQPSTTSVASVAIPVALFVGAVGVTWFVVGSFR
jgi:hypothetical protein